MNPEKPLLNDYQPSTLIASDGTVLNAPALTMTTEEAKLLREYKKFLLRHGLKEALYCNSCFEQNRQDGTRAYVTPDQILIECRCRRLFYQGQTL